MTAARSDPMAPKEGAVTPRGRGWNLDTLEAHLKSLRGADELLQIEREKFQTERDRRYSEVNTEREKALKIKEEADKAALALAREIQSYKDEKANELREQINSERGSYATKDDLAASVRELNVVIAPLATFVSTQHGEQEGSRSSINRMLSIIAALAAISTTVSLVIGIIMAIRGLK